MTAGLIRTLGPSAYGTLLVVLAASNLSMAINPAIAASTTKYVSEATGSRASANTEAARIVSASAMIVAAIGALFLITTLLFGNQLMQLLLGTVEAGVSGDAGPEEIAYRSGWIKAHQVEKLMAGMGKTGYASYLAAMLQEG